MGALYDWLKTGAEAVPHDLAEQRAMTCAMCPLNKRGGVLTFFTRPAARLIREQIERKNDMSLWTSVDALLGLCKACRCWMAVKCHAPEKVILDNLKPKTRAKLHPDCWILALEEKALREK